MSRLILTGLTVLMMAIPSLGLAHEEMSRHCKSDIEKYCKDVKPGEGRVWKCLKNHESSLTAECKEHMIHAKAKHEACEGDVDKFCSSVKGHHKKVHACLKEHKSELSQSCKDAHPYWYK